MGEGLRNHYHQYYEHESQSYYDNKRQSTIKKIAYRCMICGKMYYDRYECKPPPANEKQSVLKRNKRRHNQ